MFNKITRLSLLGLIVIGLLLSVLPGQAAALSGSDFIAGRIMDDSVLFDSNRMAAQDVQNFLSSKVPTCDTNGEQLIHDSEHGDTVKRVTYANRRGISAPFTCLKDYRQDTPAKAADQFCRELGGGEKSAAQIMKDVSDACSMSPMALLVILQREQSLVTDDWPWPRQYRSAAAFGCPDSAPCDAEYYGFFNQVYNAARQFQRYAKQPQNYNYRSGRINNILYHPNSACGRPGVHVVNNATAGLYNYMPYQPNQAALNNLYGLGDSCSSYGNRNFWRIYNDWFGSPITDFCFYDAAVPVAADIQFRKLRPHIDSGNLLLYRGTRTNCIESHTWGRDFNAWQENTASNHPIINPADSMVRYADLDGDGRDEPMLIGLHNTGSGMVEFHIWQYNMRKWIVHGTSNQPASATNIDVMFADINGDGRDEPILVGYAGTTSGMIELHYWNEGVQTWRDHVITNHPVIDPAKTLIDFADLGGDGRDEAVLIGANNTDSGMVEFHVWNPGLWSWQSHVISNQQGIDLTTSNILFADLNGDKIDEAVLIGKQDTGSGRVEFHIWNGGLDSWHSHHASNQSTF